MAEARISNYLNIATPAAMRRCVVRARLWSVIVAAALQSCGGSGGGTSAEDPPPPPPPPPPSAGVLQLDSATYEVGEATQTVSFTVTRTGGSAGRVTVDISTSDGTAVASEDYGATTVTAEFEDGETREQTGTFIIFDNSIHEPDETVMLALSGVTGGATIGDQDSAVVTIVDDDPASFTVSGTIEGLAGDGLVLRNNGGDDLPVGSSDEAFQFPASVFEGEPYDVTVATQPWAPAQSCEVTNGTGTANAAGISDVLVTCVDVPLQSMLVELQVGGQSDLYVVAEDGNGFFMLADAAESERFSGFNGERVVFSRAGADGGDLYSILPDASELVPLATEANHEWFGGFAAAGSLVVFQRWTTTSAATDDVYVIGVDGTGLLPLATTPDDEHFRAVSPGSTGERAILSRTTGGQDDLISVNLDGSDPIPVAASAEFEEFAAVTPGGRVLFHRISGGQRDLYSVLADGTGLVALSAEPVPDEFVSMLDGERLLYHRETAPFQYDLYAVNADGTEHAVLADSSDSERFAGVTAGGRIVFAGESETEDQHDLYAIDADGTDLAILTATLSDEEFIGSLPDGRVVYVRFDGAQSELSDIYLVGADGSGTLQLTDTVEPEWMNNEAFDAGDRLIFVRESAGQDDLFSITLDGSDQQNLSDTPDAYEYPVAITDSGGIIHEVDRDSGVDLQRIGADGNGFAVLGSTDDDERLVTILSPGVIVEGRVF